MSTASPPTRPGSRERFADRHIGPDPAAQRAMLDALGLATLDELVARTVPGSIRDDALELPPAASEPEVLARLRTVAGRNQVLTSLIGLGYSDTITPPVILRNVLENPAWYTAYTPYQPEISQGRLEALLNFQTMVSDLTGMDLANASLLDEGTAAAEAMTLLHRVNPKGGDIFLVDDDCHPQTIAVVQTRAAPLGIDVVVCDVEAELDTPGVFGVLLQEPGSSGRLRAHATLIDRLHARGALVAVATDLLALTLVTPAGEQGADVVVGSSQRFGVPLGFGGPHAAFIAVRDEYKRNLPGRLVGVSVDADGHPALRLALQTREQHIRREKATSNICTAQVLLAVIAGLYATYHGPDGLHEIAKRVHRHAVVLADGLRAGGLPPVHGAFFDTVRVSVPGRASSIAASAAARGVNLRIVDEDTLGISVDETTTPDVLTTVWDAFGIEADAATLERAAADAIPGELVRTSAYLTHPVFHRYRSETEMLRYLRRLADRDLALDRTMIP
ncbi:MAG TPA: glycine dehydrogenase (aminomethyl-transferring), partial [Acidimicrobiia bacterium]